MRALIAKYFIVLCSRFPLAVCHFVGSLLGMLMFYITTKQKNVLKKNIDMCFPTLSKAERNQLYKRSFKEIGKCITETGAMLHWNKKKISNIIKQVKGQEILESALSKRRGVLVALPHLGSWEIFGLYCSIHHPMTALYKPLRLSMLDPIIINARERFGAHLVPTTLNGIRAINKALKRNEIAVILPDQDPGRNRGVFAPFFGIETATMTLLPRLAHQTQSEVVIAYTERLPHGAGFNIYFRKGSEEISNPDLGIATRALNHDIEQCVLQQPEQYQWTYKRFKSRPSKEPKRRY